jgi:hypothetical protein
MPNSLDSVSIQHSIYAHAEEGGRQSQNPQLPRAIFVPRFAHLDDFSLKPQLLHPRIVCVSSKRHERSRASFERENRGVTKWRSLLTNDATRQAIFIERVGILEVVLAIPRHQVLEHHLESAPATHAPPGSPQMGLQAKEGQLEVDDMYSRPGCW